MGRIKIAFVSQNMIQKLIAEKQSWKSRIHFSKNAVFLNNETAITEFQKNEALGESWLIVCTVNNGRERK